MKHAQRYCSVCLQSEQEAAPRSESSLRSEVYVPKALQHMDDSTDMNKTLPVMGKHLPKTIHPELHKTTIGPHRSASGLAERFVQQQKKTAQKNGFS